MRIYLYGIGLKYFIQFVGDVLSPSVPPFYVPFSGLDWFSTTFFCSYKVVLFYVNLTYIFGILVYRVD